MNDRAAVEGPKHKHRFGNGCGAHVFLEALRRHKVEVMFGQSIPSVLHLIAPEFGIRQIGYRTENAGAAMADAYARVSGKVPVVTAQNGPAATLLVPGLAEPLKASIPIVAIVQDVQRSNRDRNAFQDLDHLALFGGCAKWIRRVDSLDRIADYVDMAFTAAAGGRPGPAVLLCPIDLFEDPIAGSMPSALTPSRQSSLGAFRSIGRSPIVRASSRRRSSSLPPSDPSSSQAAESMFPERLWRLLGCKKSRPCRSRRLAWAKARSPRIIPSRSASSAISWAAAVWLGICATW